MKIECLKSKDIKSYIDLINKSFGYLSNTSNVKKMMKKSMVLIIKKEDKVIATTTLTKNKDYIQNKTRYNIDYVCVDSDYRRLKLGTYLFKEINRLAIKNKIDYLYLTSSKKKVGTKEFYHKIGFTEKDTTVYIKNVLV